MKKETILSTLLGIFIGAAAGIGLSHASKSDKVNEFDKVKKFKSYYNMLNQWIILKNKGKSLNDYFVENKIHKIAVYGMGEIGERFLEEMSVCHDVEICYAIDQNADGVLLEIPVKTLDDMLEPVDAVIVTAVFAFDSIAPELKAKTSAPIISLKEIIQELL